MMCGFSGSEKGARVSSTLLRPSAPLPKGGGLHGPRSRRAGAEAAVAAAATATAVRAGEGPGAAAMERQRWLPLEANPEVSAALISAGDARGGAGSRAAAAGSGPLVSKSCSPFRFQVTNQVSEVLPLGTLEPSWPSPPPRCLGAWDLIREGPLEGVPISRPRRPHLAPGAAPSCPGSSRGPLPPTSRSWLSGREGCSPSIPFAHPLFVLRPAGADSTVFPPQDLLGDEFAYTPRLQA